MRGERVLKVNTESLKLPTLRTRRIIRAVRMPQPSVPIAVLTRAAPVCIMLIPRLCEYGFQKTACRRFSRGDSCIENRHEA